MFVLGKIQQERQGEEQETVCHDEVDHVHLGLSPPLEFAAEDPEGNCVQWDPQSEHWDVDNQLEQHNATLCFNLSAVSCAGLSLQGKSAGMRLISVTGSVLPSHDPAAPRVPALFMWAASGGVQHQHSLSHQSYTVTLCQL